MTRKHILALLISLAAAASTFAYVEWILIPHEEAMARANQIPRGNLSDLYPRWLGARELLLHQRDPYTPEITRQIQTGYYGRPIDPSLPNDPKDQQGFAYPVYVVFLLAPTLKIPFLIAQRIFLLLLVIVTAWSVALWMRVVSLQVSLPVLLIWIVFTLGCFPAIQGIKLQQLTLLVAGFLALALSALAGGHLILAGILLALATIKPQLSVLPIAFLGLWSVGRWRERRRFVFAFAATMLLLVGGGEVLLPGWIGEFRGASAEYLRYTGGGRSVLDVELSPAWGRVVSIGLICVLIYFAWTLRRAPARSADFAWGVCLTMVTTLEVIPMFAPYNQVLLLPAAMLLVRYARPLWRSGRLYRFVSVLTALSVFWPWIATLGLMAVSLFLSKTAVQSAWAMPLYSNFATPTLMFGLVLISGRVLLRAPSEAVL